MDYEDYAREVEQELCKLIPVSKDFSETVTMVNRDRVMAGYHGGISAKSMAEDLERLFEYDEEE